MSLLGFSWESELWNPSTSKAVLKMGSLNGLSKNSSPNKLSKLSSHCLEEVRWESTGSPLGVHWESTGSPLAVPWESAGSPLGVHWGLLGVQQMVSPKELSK